MIARNFVIGLVGQPSSGKDTVAEYFQERGFPHVATSNLIREEMRAKGIETTRLNTSNFARDTRKVRGGGYLAEEAIRRISGHGVISGLRSTKEIEVLKKKFGTRFFLIAVEAPIESRYRWARERKRIGDDISFEQFKAEEDRERNGSPETQEVDRVISMADETIKNEGTKEELLAEAKRALTLLEKKSIL